MKHTPFILLTCALTLAACHRKPEGVLSEEKLANLLADLNVADAYIMTEGLPGQSRAGYADSDSLNKIMRQSVMLQHGVSEQDFARTLDWYGHHLDRYEEVCELQLQAIQKRKGVAGQAAGPSGDNLWNQSISLRMGGNTGRDTLTFTIPAEGLKPGDRLELTFNTTALTAPLTAVVAADYTDGSSVLASSNITGAARTGTSLQLDSTLTPRSIYGYIATPQSSTLLLDSIALRRLPLNDVKYYDIHSQRRLPAPAGAAPKPADNRAKGG